MSGSPTTRLILALNRAWITPFTKADWSAFCDAVGNAQMVKFHPEDAEYLRQELGITHWHPDYTVVILDANGLTWTASGPVNGYAFQVRVNFSTEISDAGTADQYWQVEDRGVSAVETAIAALPPHLRLILLACPEDARPYVLQGMDANLSQEYDPPELEPVSPRAWIAQEDGEWRVWVANKNGYADKSSTFAGLGSANGYVNTIVPGIKLEEIAYRIPMTSEAAAVRLEAASPPADWSDLPEASIGG
jgi:hypothetical protein